MKTLKDRYPHLDAIKEDWDQKIYLCVTLEFDYKKRTCKMLLPGYVKQTLIKFHQELSKTTHSPSPYKSPVYRRKIQKKTIDTTNPITTVQTKILQQVCGTFLYYARAVDCIMLRALNNLATRVKDGTQKTVEALNHFLDYCATHPEAVVLY